MLLWIQSPLQVYAPLLLLLLGVLVLVCCCRCCSCWHAVSAVAVCCCCCCRCVASVFSFEVYKTKGNIACLGFSWSQSSSPSVAVYYCCVSFKQCVFAGAAAAAAASAESGFAAARVAWVDMTRMS